MGKNEQKIFNNRETIYVPGVTGNLSYTSRREARTK